MDEVTMLRKAGYLANVETVELALKNFQGAYGLSQTCEFDEDTLRILKRLCGVPPNVETD